MSNFLHIHPLDEKEFGEVFAKNHVIIDKKDWETALLILNPSLNLNTEVKEREVIKGYNPPPVEKLDPKLRPTCGIKHDSDKPRFDLLPADALEEVAKIYTVGAKEYGDRNWELGMNYGRLFRALMSHAWAWWKGERDDSKNKLHHLTSVVFNALALLHYELNPEKFSKFDNRK